MFPKKCLSRQYLICAPQFPVIAFGTGSTMKNQDVTDYVNQAIENGFSHIDTAQCMLLLTATINRPSYDPLEQFIRQKAMWAWPSRSRVFLARVCTSQPNIAVLGHHSRLFNKA